MSNHIAGVSPQMLGLCVNTFIDVLDKDEYKAHQTKASTMDLGDISQPRVDINIDPDQHMPPLETDDDAREDIAGPALDIAPLRIIGPSRIPREPQGTPVGYTGSSAGTTHDPLPERASALDPRGTPGGCSTSSSPRQRLVVPRMEELDLLDQRTRPSLDLFRTTRRRMKKIPYVELPEGAIIDVSDEDEGDMDIMVELGVDYDKNKRVKEEALSVAELNAKLE